MSIALARSYAKDITFALNKLSIWKMAYFQAIKDFMEKELMVTYWTAQVYHTCLCVHLTALPINRKLGNVSIGG